MERARPALAMLRRRWRLTVAAVLTMVLVLAGLVALAYHEGVFVRGPAADAAAAFLSDVEHGDYTAAYGLLAPDLRAGETRQTFAGNLEAIRQTDGPITSFAAREMHDDASFTVVGFDVTRALRGTFSAHVRLLRDSSGQWLVSGVDDL